MYDVEMAQVAEEMEWLRDSNIFPATEETFVWDKDNQLKRMMTFGMIINEEQLLFIKLRHSKLKSTTEYRQR